MKKLLWTIFVLTISVNSKAQLTVTDSPKEIQIGVARAGGFKQSELFYFVDQSGDTAYRFTYLDKTYTAIKVWNSVIFKGGATTLNSLYDLLKSVLASEKDVEKTFKLGEADFLIRSKRSFGTRYLAIAITNLSGTGITDLTESQLDKLFGR